MTAPFDPVPLGPPPALPARRSQPLMSSSIGCRANKGFLDWIAQLPGCLIVSTYQANILIILGWDGKQLSVHPKPCEKPMGVAVSAGPDRPAKVAVATKHAITVFADAPLLAPELLPGEPGKHDALFLPRATLHTNDINTHDLAWVGAELWAVATRFGCLATLSDEFGFVPRWKPKWVTALAPEDRCHLNGLAVADGRARWVTALGETDAPGAWRENKATGGVLVDVASDEVVVRGLAMPHSPRWANGKVWFLNSGAGEVWALDPATGTAGPVAELPGYLRGLAVVGDYAVVGMSRVREQHIFGGLPVQARHPDLVAGVAVVDLTTGRTVGTFEFTGGCQEVYEVAVLPGLRKPALLTPDDPVSRQAFPGPGFAYWVRPENLVADFAPDAIGPAVPGNQA